MKKYSINKLKIGVLFTLLVASSSCREDFLMEELTTQRSTDFYNTEEGIQQLVIGAYVQVFRTSFNTETHFVTTNYGTDEFHIGGDGSNAPWNNYDGSFKSIVTATNGNTQPSERPWNNLYVGISLANQIIKSATEINSTNAAIKQKALGEGHFMRAYNYLRLVRQYGGVPLKLTVSTTVEQEFKRETAEDVYKQVIEDFTKAYELLDNTGPAPAKITKDAAAHFLAKALLSRASEINDSWNSATKAADLAKVVSLSDEVIARHPLAANFQDLWKYTKPNDVNESLPELILSAQFTGDQTASSVNFSHVIFTSRYDDLPFMQRDLTGMRPYSRLAATYFTYDIFDHVNDSRFWKTFRTKSRLNKGSGDYSNGDLGIIYIINNKDDKRFAETNLSGKYIDPKTGKTVPNAWVAYAADQKSLLIAPRFPSLTKHFDGARIAINELNGTRDVILARSGETYLMAAEAKIRLAKLGQGTYADALIYINAIRNRAAYKEGESRSYYTDGAAAYVVSPLAPNPNVNSFMNENSYYESNNIPETTAATSLEITGVGSLPAEDEAVNAKLNIAGDYDKMLALVLNERTRELCGEFHRWEDLSRTKTLVSRARAYNPGAAPNVQDYHLLRPIPQTFLDAILSNGNILTAEEKQAMQNTGY